jgi:hypothetical protein
MAVEDFLRGAADGFDDGRAEGDVGDEVAVHDVEVDPVGAGGIDCGHLFAEAGKVGRKD